MNLFLHDEDKLRFLDTMAKTKEKYNCLVYGYCLMDNHVHLLINDNVDALSPADTKMAPSAHIN